MSPGEVAHAIRLRLAEELTGERAALSRLAASIQELDQTPAGTVRESHTLALALAFQLGRFFTAIESVLARVLRTLDGDVPGGPDWHQELLRAAAVPIPELRPALIPREALPLLRELLGFRHFARHGYDVTPDPDRLHELARVAGEAHAHLERALVALDARLRADAAR